MITLSDDELINELRKRVDDYKNELTFYKNQTKEMNDRLNKSEALKSHFISNITNEIINPFASILALSTEIQHTQDIKCDKVKMMISLIHSETFYLDFQLRNIFAAAKIEAGESVPEISKVAINKMFSNTIELFELEAKKRNIAIEIQLPDEEIIFNTDSGKLKLIFINILSNALKFSKNDNKIVITLKIDSKELNLTIKDQGIGIPKAFHSDIFNRFSRYDDTINSVIRGQGLGLSITKAYIDMLNGTISIDSEVGKGTTVTVKIKESEVEPNDFTDGNEFIFDEDLVF